MKSRLDNDEKELLSGYTATVIYRLELFEYILNRRVKLYQRNNNRRDRARFSIDINGYYYYSNNWQKCRIYDLNLEGAGLRLSQFFVIGDIIKLKFGTDNEQVVVDSEVMNVNGPRIGIQFINLDDFDKEIIKKVVNSYSKRYKLL